MKRFIWIGLLALLSAQWMQGQHFPKMDTRNYVSDSTVFMPKKPWLAAGEVFGLNVGIWAFDRLLILMVIRLRTISKPALSGIPTSFRPIWWRIPTTARFTSMPHAATG